MLQILRFRRVADTRHSWRCVSKIQSVGQESLAARGVRFGALITNGGTCYCHLESKFLGFHCKRPWSTPVWLVSSSEGWICTDLKG